VTRSVRWMKPAALGLAALFVVCAIWAMVAQTRESSARSDLSDAQGAYAYAELREPTNPTMEQAMTVTANDIALGQASRQIDSANTAISSGASNFTTALVLGGLCAFGAVALIIVARIAVSTRRCAYCQRRMRVAASVCPSCRRDVLVDPYRGASPA
jgi:hypothetical protein